MKQIILWTFSLFFLSCGRTDSSMATENQAKAEFSKEQLQEDFKVYRTSLEEIHPALYAFISKDSLDYHFNKAYSNLPETMSKDEFYKVLSTLTKKIFDEHTFLNFTYKYNSLKKFMPIKVRWINNVPYIHKNLLNNPDIFIGSELVSINGRNPHEIYQEIVHNYGKTIDQRLEYEVNSLHFDYLYASFYEQPDTFHITAINPTTKKQYTVNTPCLLKSDSLHFIPVYKLAEEYCKQDSCLIFNPDKKNNIAILKIPGFRPPCGNEFYKRLEEVFKIIRNEKISNLIVDLRYNGGGDPKYGAALLSYISEKPFHIFDTMTSVLNKRPTFYKCLDSTNQECKNWKDMINALNALSKPNSSYYANFRDTIFNPKKDLFKGQVYLLINSDIHSAAAITASLFDYYSNVTIIGTPIEPPYNSGNAMELYTLTLPNSKLELYIPLIHYSYDVPDKLYTYKKGIYPDIYVRPDISDGINKDAVLDTTITIIKSKK